MFLPGDYNATNPLQPDYMQPKCWWVLGQKVHASRMISVFDNPPPLLLRPSYNFLGIPQAQILWDYVLHWNECRIYTADLLKKISSLSCRPIRRPSSARPAACSPLISVCRPCRDTATIILFSSATSRMSRYPTCRLHGGMHRYRQAVP